MPCGSIGLAAAFWEPLRAAGGEVRQFNPLDLGPVGIRNHRKLLVCDERVAFVGGFNIAAAYDGDGVTRGWCDLGLRVGGPLPGQLAATFEQMFARADFQHKRFIRLRKSTAQEYGADPARAAPAQRPGTRSAARSSGLCAGIWRGQRTCRSWLPIFCRPGAFGGT